MLYKEIVCKYCKETAQVPISRRIDYCNKEECRKKEHNAQARQHYEKNKEVYSQKREDNMIEKYEQQIINDIERKVDTYAIDNAFFDDIRGILRAIGKIRFTLIQMLKNEKEKIAKIDKFDDMVIHKAEFENMSKTEVYILFKKLARDRKERRQAKYRKAIIEVTLNCILIKAPEKLLNLILIWGKTTRNFENELPKYIEELKKDEKIFIQKVA